MQLPWIGIKRVTVKMTGNITGAARVDIIPPSSSKRWTFLQNNIFKTSLNRLN